jgi:hypothetical protein
MRFVYAFLFATLFASAAPAAPPAAKSDGIAAAVQRQFLAPFAKWQEERGKFSRADMPPSELRVRALGAPLRDAAGAEFVAFAVDARDVDGKWNEADMTGCVYVASSAVYVKRGSGFLAAADYFAASAVPARSACKIGSG